jgi:hypothetical protein
MYLWVYIPAQKGISTSRAKMEERSATNQIQQNCKDHIYQRIYSWAQPSYCESEKEYHVSKALFM